MFSGGIDLDHSLLFIPPVRPGLRGHPFKVLQGPYRRLRRKLSFSIRLVKYWNRLPTSTAIAPSVNACKRQLDSAWEELFAEVPRFPVLICSPLSPPIRKSPFTLFPFIETPHLVHCLQSLMHTGCYNSINLKVRIRVCVFKLSKQGDFRK